VACAFLGLHDGRNVLIRLGAADFENSQGCDIVTISPDQLMGWIRGWFFEQPATYPGRGMDTSRNQSSVARDNLHILLVGPLFGKEWIGYYAWALQICLVSSQVFAQISARVSLPLLAQAGSFQRDGNSLCIK